MIVEPNNQLDEWVKGNPLHNKERDECCPDFSCCDGKLAEPEVRKRFAKAYYDNDADVQHKMLMMFLGAVLEERNINARIFFADDAENHELEQ